MLKSFDSALGFMAFFIDRGEVLAITFGHPTGAVARESLHKLLASSGIPTSDANADSVEDSFLAEQLEERLTCFAKGEAVDFDDLPISLAGLTRFQRLVVAACRAIPWGETLTYGELAESVGHPGAARAVGSVMSSNRIPLVIPCHRVLASGGRLGGYSAPQGLAMKERLLEAEQAALAELAQ
ncbi:methylated-DNA--[protein]-cysteine S-methyltransferase [Bythopirellula polymerisocia]|uniref:methylated-DNA--[protein]-cysteine S-methyltransferase n=1 Tax=Bythopirellula polymerisocia TaxID=2528003 RepID=A0A5C6CXH6_9BACT|nr:methylated-DNA--[protein]-cysteine S-methyltransferase [Bythopirellula polymerisocia]TWU29240.1 Methylated-DNA--protein-cysteine methyltransferase [Bythopirellula polymerisocia]